MRRGDYVLADAIRDITFLRDDSIRVRYETGLTHVGSEIVLH
jgi:hypothetical protein